MGFRSPSFGEMLDRTVWMKEKRQHRRGYYIDRRSAHLHMNFPLVFLVDLQVRTRSLFNPSTQQVMCMVLFHFSTVYATQRQESRNMVTSIFTFKENAEAHSVDDRTETLIEAFISILRLFSSTLYAVSFSSSCRETISASSCQHIITYNMLLADLYTEWLGEREQTTMALFSSPLREKKRAVYSRKEGLRRIRGALPHPWRDRLCFWYSECPAKMKDSAEQKDMIPASQDFGIIRSTRTSEHHIRFIHLSFGDSPNRTVWMEGGRVTPAEVFIEHQRRTPSPMIGTTLNFR
jgi:hypothetical protein